MKIDRLLKKYGRTVYLSGGDGWRSRLFGAVLQPLRYKTKLYLSGDYTPIGKNSNDVYWYIGPPEHDLSRLGREYRLNDSEGGSYLVDKAERVFSGNRAVYCWAVLRKTEEGDLI